MRGSIKDDDMAVFIISHCPCLISIFQLWYSIDVMYATFTSSHIEEHCIGLQMLSHQDCSEITDTGLITISEHFNN